MSLVDLVRALRQAVPRARVSSEPPDRRAYSRDLWPRGLIELAADAENAPGPAAIIWPEALEDVVALVRFARQEGVQLVPFGAGSGVCGAVRPGAASVVVDLKRFTDFRVGAGPELDVGAGALGITLEQALVERGLTTGHYPSSILISTAGGWVAARGAGQCSGRYGKIEDMVTWLEVVLGTGEPMVLRRRDDGPDLIPLLIGSEGTLGIITRVGLRLHPAPAARAFAAFAFEDVSAGVAALRAIFQAGLRPAVARLYDPLDTLMMADEERVKHAPAHPPGEPGLRAAALRTVLRAPSLIGRAMFAAEKSLYSRSALVLVHEGEPAALASEVSRVSELCRAARGVPLGEGPARAWYHHRYSVSYRQAPLFRGGAFVDTMEVAAPWSKLLGVYDAVRAALSNHALVMAHFSHSYPDGASIYFTFAGSLADPDTAAARYDRAWRVALSAALDAGATLSHHHGVGRSKAPRLGEELGAAVDVIRKVKAAWDPEQILNPGVLIPSPSAAEAREVPPPPRAPRLDADSGTCRFPATMSLGAAQSFLAEHGRELGFLPGASVDLSQSLDAWVGLGMPGLLDRYEDPVSVRLPGYSATLRSGLRFELPASPRRATGPDLSALFIGMRGRFGHLESLSVFAPELGAPRPASLPYAGPRSAPVAPAEASAIERLERGLVAS